MDNPEKMGTQGTLSEEKQNTICIGHYYVQANTYNVNKTRFLLQTTGGSDEPNIVFYAEIVTGNTTRKSECNET